MLGVVNQIIMWLMNCRILFDTCSKIMTLFNGLTTWQSHIVGRFAYSFLPSSSLLLLLLSMLRHFFLIAEC